MRAAGIGVNVHYIPVHTQPYYRRLGFATGMFPEAESYYEDAITLPLFSRMTNDEQDTVVAALKKHPQVKIAVIPARGGSKRIPRKNIRAFCGRPIIAYSIAAARETGLFDHVVVSTDDEEIASVARECGATTPFIRPKEIADDFTGTNAVVKHAVAWFNAAGPRRHHRLLRLCDGAAAPGAVYQGRL